LQEHWDGLTVFVEHPEVPLDNNRAERVERGPVVLRKNSYGSAAVWAGELAALLFSVSQTLCLWNLNPRAWLTAYLQACAEGGGAAPKTLDDFLPWKMSEQKRKEWALEKEQQAGDSSWKQEQGRGGRAEQPNQEQPQQTAPAACWGSIDPPFQSRQASRLFSRPRFTLRTG
jgi:hypothetical protein